MLPSNIWGPYRPSREQGQNDYNINIPQNGKPNEDKIHHRNNRHRKNRHRKNHHRKRPSDDSHRLQNKFEPELENPRSIARDQHSPQISQHTLCGPTSPPVWRDECPAHRCANKVGPEPSHKYRSHRGIRSATQILARKAQRKENRRRIRREYRQVRKRWVELAKTPAKPTLAQERILAEELYSQPQPNTDRSDYKHPPCNNLKIVHTDLRIATFNLKGMNYIAARQQIVYLMQKHNIHVAALQETHINYTGKEQHGDYNFYFSSNIDDEQRKETDIHLEALNQRLRKKQITEVEAKRERMTIINRSTEKLGVGFLYKKSFFDSAEIDIKSLNNRVMSMKIHSTPIPINIINLYAPHAGHSAQTKMEFYNLAHQLTQEIPSHSIKIIVGDFNARLIEALPHEQHLIGAHVYCAENNSIHDLTNEQIDNRHNFIFFCLENL